MEVAFSAEAFAGALALIGLVIVIAALLSGAIERSGLPQVALFLALGATLGPFGLGLIEFPIDSPALRTVATLSLVLVLFADSVTVDVAELRRHGALASLVLGPGTLLSAVLVAAAGYWLLDLSAPAAAILGAALASTDPVMMRALLRRDDVPAAARHALRVESGLNDVVVLPIVLIAMSLMGPEAAAAEPRRMGRLAVEIFVLGPAAGAVVGLAAVSVLDLVRRKSGVRRDYESIYVLGVAFTAFAAAEALHGSGYMAAFAAGLTVAVLDVELCECFLDYGEATAEMFLLFTFVAFGSSLIWRGLTVVRAETLAFAAVAVLVRTPVLWLALRRLRLDRPSRLLIVWFGPRGLSSLLLVLLPVFAGVPGSEALFAVSALVVLLSIVFHGGLLLVLTRRGATAGRRAAVEPAAAVGATRVGVVGAGAAGDAGGGDGAGTAPLPWGAPPETEDATRAPAPRHPSSAPGIEPAHAPAAPTSAVATAAPSHPELITLDELGRLRESGEPVVLLDVRTDRSYREGDLQARGAIRLPPERGARGAAQLALPRHAWLVAYCA